VLAAAGDIPTLETVAAAWILRKYAPEIKVRVVNVVDLMTLSPPAYHPHGLDPQAFVDLFTEDKTVIFAFHGYVRMIHDLVHGRPNPARFHVRGYMEEGATTTPFDMVVLNNVSRYHLAMLALKYLPQFRSKYIDLDDELEAKLAQHRIYIQQYLDDMPEIKDWKWTES
jgi:xylulose-5-phosphate/fructose-6-phosphate phosphoketolase